MDSTVPSCFYCTLYRWTPLIIVTAEHSPPERMSMVRKQAENHLRVFITMRDLHQHAPLPGLEDSQYFETQLHNVNLNNWTIWKHLFCFRQRICTKLDPRYSQLSKEMHLGCVSEGGLWKGVSSGRDFFLFWGWTNEMTSLWLRKIFLLYHI